MATIHDDSEKIPAKQTHFTNRAPNPNSNELFSGIQANSMTWDNTGNHVTGYKARETSLYRSDPHRDSIYDQDGDDFLASVPLP